MMLNRNVVEYTEIDFTDGYQVRIEHEHEQKYDTHTITFKRRNINPEFKDKQVYSDIQFNLDTEHFKQFCKFFNMIGDSYGNE
jgi:hypothetical protein